MVANAIVVAQPRQRTGLLLSQANEILRLKAQFKKGVHYGAPYPGSKKDTLLKPGAELLARRFGLRPRYDQLQADVVINWETPERSYIIYRYRCVMIDITSGAEVGEAIGSCTSLEEKYRYRTAKRICPSCGKETIMENKASKGPGFYCWKNLNPDACGTNFGPSHPEYNNIKNQEVGKAINLNPFDIMNTIDKMAQKRAMNSSVLVATGASSYFAPGDDEVSDLYEVASDDIEVIDGEFAVLDDMGDFPDDQPRNTEPQKPAPKPAQPKQPETPQVGTWANEANLKAIVATFTNGKPNTYQIEGLTLGEMTRLAGIESADNYDAWNKAYPQGKLVVPAVIKAFEDEMKATPPAQPKSAAVADHDTNPPMIIPPDAPKELTSRKARYIKPEKGAGFTEWFVGSFTVRMYDTSNVFKSISSIPDAPLPPEVEYIRDHPGEVHDMGLNYTFQWELAKNGSYATVVKGSFRSDEVPF